MLYIKEVVFVNFKLKLVGREIILYLGFCSFLYHANEMTNYLLDWMAMCNSIGGVALLDRHQSR